MNLAWKLVGEKRLGWVFCGAPVTQAAVAAVCALRKCEGQLFYS